MAGQPEAENDDEAAKRLLRQVFDLWVNPEITRRVQAGTLTPPLQLYFAQVLMNVGEPIVVRLNDEVRAHLLVRVTRDVERGDPVHLGDFDQVRDVELTDDDPNAAHVTLARVKDHWALFVDFRYNAERVHQTLSAATEFLATAEYALQRQHRRAFAENLFATAELVAKAQLLLLPDERLLNSKTHKFISSRINIEAKLGNVEQSFVEVLNELGRQRGTARYVGGDVAYSPDRMTKMVETVRSALERTEQQAPARRNPDPPAVRNAIP